ncbi:MAG: Ig-like domain-containing protein, partial [Nocardioides sp.]
MRRPGGLIRRHRAAIAANLALVVMVGTVVAYAVSADGYESHRADLNDGGIWVTSNADGIFGRINKPINQADGAMFAAPDDNLDIVQQGAAVVGVNLTDNLLTSIDPATVQPNEGEEAAIPPGAQVVMAGGSLAVLDPGTGRLWATRVDAVTGLPSVNALADASDPLVTVGKAAALTVTATGDVLAVSSESDRVVTLATGSDGFTKPAPVGLGADVGAEVALTSVGERGVVLDEETGELEVLGGATAALPRGSVLQQPGPAAGTVLVATRRELLEVDLVTGLATSVQDGLSGRPTAPVRLGDCRYAAWSGGRGGLVTACGGDEPVTAFLVADATDLVFRVNRGQIVLNDRSSGAVWDLDSDEPARIDDWDAFRSKVEKSDKEKDEENQDDGDRQPPKAKPDDVGARPGRTTVLHPLDNDTAPSGRILAIRSVGEVSGAGTVSIGPDGQTIQIVLPADASGTTTFEYVIDDGREDVSDHATVSVRSREVPLNGEPSLRPGYRQREWIVASSGVLDVPVLSDWRDPRDGDPLALVGARAVGGDQSGAVARPTGAGRVRLTAPVEAGVVQVEYSVSDGLGDPVTEQLEVRVQGREDTQSFAAVAEPDIVSGETGKQITIRPLGNDLPGSDPLTPEATIALAGKVAAVGGADIRTDLVEGTITFRSQTPRTYLLDYDASYGSAPIAPGRIRVDVREPQRPALDPVAMPDQVTLFGQAATLVDVLANDVDPAGGMLVVQRADPAVENQLDVAVVQGRWVRVSARQGAVTPNPQVIRYTISNGDASGIEGEITLSQRPPLEDNTPVTQVDQVTVRAGTGVTVPALDNDFSPSGDQLRLVSHLAGEASGRLRVTGVDGAGTGGDAGEAFVAGRLVRYVAPATVGDELNLQVRYLATNELGQTAPGRVEITVVPAQRRNQAPEPPQLEGRTVAGDTVKLRLPGSGVDPDGDAVTLLGISTAPRFGRVTKYGANSIEYQAYPGSAGTDEFEYRVVDSLGEEAIGTARVAVVPGGLPQPPLAVSDAVSVAPGRSATVDLMANDLIAGGDRVTVELPDAPRGVRLASETGPVVIDPSAKADNRNIDVVYRLTNGIDTSQATITLRTVKDFNNPPLVYDAFGTAADADTVTVDALETAYDPDGDAEDLAVTEVFVPPGTPAAEVRDGRITVSRGDQPSVVPFRVEDADGGVATASLYVPARGSNLPYVRQDALITLEPGESVRARLADYVVNPAGGPVGITLPDRVSSSPVGGVAVAAAGKGAVTLRAAKQYAGPGALVVEVTTGTSVNDPAGLVSLVTIPVQVGDTRPILRCPNEAIEVPQGDSVEVSVSAYCHVWTADPDATAGLSFEAEWDEPVDGLTADSAGGVIEVSAAVGAERDRRGVLAVTAGGSAPGLIRFVVTGGPPPSLSPIRFSDMRSGQTRVFDLAPYLRPGVGDATPTVLEASQITGLDVDISIVSDTEVQITTGPRVSGQPEFRIVMSDVPRADAGPQRRVEGRITLDVLDVPDAPNPPVPGSAVVSQQVSLTWGEPASNGAPIDSYQVRASGGATRSCAATACEISGLTNGRTYTFQVRAHNSVGFSEWSGSSRGATPDEKPGLVGTIRNTRVADRTLVIAWSPPGNDTSKISYYVVTYGGTSRKTFDPEATITGLDNNLKYAFKVYAVNDVGRGPVRTSRAMQSQGPVGIPAAPTVEDTPSSASTATLTITWPAVPPNGPGPVNYRVLRNGTPVPGCDTVQAGCSIPGVNYDGSRNTFSVGASVGKEPPRFGPAKDWYAVGKPDPWGAW